MTLTKSYTTRRSHPITRSRLRRPTSKSIATVRKPRDARPAARFADVVVLPTPPLPEVTTITLDTEHLLRSVLRISVLYRTPCPRAKFSDRVDHDAFPREVDARRLAAPLGRDVVGHDVPARDRQELGAEAHAEDAGVRVVVHP